jgi:hypothetical protein
MMRIVDIDNAKLDIGDGAPYPNYKSRNGKMPRKLLDNLLHAKNPKASVSSNFKIIKIVGIYRYISLLVTSLMFMLINTSLVIEQKLVIILFLAIEAQSIIVLYNKHSSNLKKIRGVIVLEILVNVILLFITGNLASPFVWYTLNSVISTAVFYKEGFCWESLGIYLIGALVGSAIYYNNHFDRNFIISYWSLCCISFLIVFGLRMLMKHTEEVHKKSELLLLKNKELIEFGDKLSMSNKYMAKSEKQILNLHQYIEKLAALEDIVEMIKIFVQYAVELTNNDKTFFWYLSDSGKYHIEVNNEEITKNKKDLLAARLYEETRSLESFQNMTSIKVLNDKYLLYQIASNSKLYGVIGVKVLSEENEYHTYGKQLSCLKALSLMSIERLELKRFSKKFKQERY